MLVRHRKEEKTLKKEEKRQKREESGYATCVNKHPIVRTQVAMYMYVIFIEK